MRQYTILGLLVLLLTLVAGPLRGEEDSDNRIRAAAGLYGGNFIPPETGKKAFEHVRQAFAQEVSTRGIEATKKALWDYIFYRAPDTIPGNEQYDDPFVRPFVTRMQKELEWVEVFHIDPDGRVRTEPAEWEDAINDVANVCIWRFLGENLDEQERRDLLLLSDPKAERPDDWPADLGWGANFGGNWGNMLIGSKAVFIFYGMRAITSNEERLDFLFKRLREEAAYTNKKNASQHGMAAVTSILEYSFLPRAKERLLVYLHSLPYDAPYSQFERGRLQEILTLHYPASESELLELLNARNALARLLGASILANMKNETAVPTLLRYCGREAIEAFMSKRGWQWDDWAQVYFPMEDAFAALTKFVHRRDVFDYFVWGFKQVLADEAAYGAFQLFFTSGLIWGMDVPAYEQEAVELLKWGMKQRSGFVLKEQHWMGEYASGSIGKVFLERYPDYLAPDEFLMLEKVLLQGSYLLSKSMGFGDLYKRWIGRRKTLQERGLIPPLQDLDLYIHPYIRREFEQDPDFPFGPLPPPKEDQNESGRKGEDKSGDVGNGENQSATRDGDLPSDSESAKPDRGAQGVHSRSVHAVGYGAVVLGVLFLCVGIFFVVRAFHR